MTPVLNAARFLPDLLASVRSQDYPHIEHIVVDGGSTDGSIEIARDEPGVILLTGSDRGMYDAINRGFDRANGDLVAYLNADDRYSDRGAVRSMVQHFEGHPEADVVYADFRYIDVSGDATAEVLAPEFSAERLYLYNFVPAHSTFIRSRVLVEDGLRPDPELRFTGDWDWFVRMARAGKCFSHLPRIVSEFRKHDGSITSTVGWRLKLSEWRRTCRRNETSFSSLLWNEGLYRPLLRRLRM